MVAKGHNYGKCRKCSKVHKPPTLGKHWKITGQALKIRQEANRRPERIKKFKQTIKKKKDNGWISPLKGKNYEEIYGVEKAKELKRKKSKPKTGQALKNIQEANRRPERREKHRQAFLGKNLEERLGSKEKADELRRKISEAKLGKTFEEICGSEEKADEWRRKKSKKQKENWQNPVYVKMMIKSWNKKPNYFETDAKKALDKIVPNQYIYTGNKSRADFTNKIDKTKIILAHGIYWHLWKKQKDRDDYTLTKKDIEKEDIKKYKKLGYKDILIIWEDDFYENINKINNQVKEFT